MVIPLSKSNDENLPRLDAKDFFLIKKLFFNGRSSLVKLGKEIGIKHSSVRDRLLKLTKNDFIKIQANINPSKFNLRAAFVSIDVKRWDNAIDILEKCKRCPRILLAGLGSGEFNVFIILIARSYDVLRDLIERCIRSQEGISRITVSFGQILVPEFLPIRIFDSKECPEGCCNCDVFNQP